MQSIRQIEETFNPSVYLLAVEGGNCYSIDRFKSKNPKLLFAFGVSRTKRLNLPH